MDRGFLDKAVNPAAPACKGLAPRNCLSIWYRRVAIAIAFAGFAALGPDDGALAANCTPLEMRLMQLQSRGSGDSPEANEVRGMLQACQGNAPQGGFSWWHAPRQVPGVQEARRSSTIRTLCVRACDGYYFPISFSTTRDQLEADEATCQRRCPAGNATLFFHASRGEISDQAISISGSRYADLENAFRYRSVLDPSCTCGQAIPDPSEEAALRPFPSVPLARADPGDDPETLLNRQGHLTYAPHVEAAASSPVTETSAEIVRVILAEGNAAQEQLMLSEVPNVRFRPEEGPFVHRGPGAIACLDHGPSCRTP